MTLLTDTPFRPASMKLFQESALVFALFEVMSSSIVSGGYPIMKIKLLVFALLSLALAFPASGKTYKSSYDIPCSEPWPAVKDTLGNADNYTVLESDDAKMTASYHVKHAVHTNVSGALLQRNNRVTLVTKGSGCEMQVVSNYSGWEHNDQGDFKTRVDDSLAKLKAAKPAKPAKPAEPAEPTKPSGPGR